MPIRDDLSGLSRGGDDEGFPPVAEPMIVRRLADAFIQRYTADGHTELAMAIDGARWRASWSSMCARAVGYNVRHFDAKRALAAAQADPSFSESELGLLAESVALTAPSDPPSGADYWRFNLGSATHEIVQAVALNAFPGAQIEVKVAIDTFGAAHADLVIDEEIDGQPFRTVCEIKSTNGFAYKLAATSFKGAPEGPRQSAIVQGAVAAEALNADRLIIALFAMENLSPEMAEKQGLGDLGRFAAEFWLTPDEFLPLAQQERKRVRRIIELVDEHKLPPRSLPSIPPGARVTAPDKKGAWTLTDESGAILRAGNAWECPYCDHAGQCVTDGPS